MAWQITNITWIHLITAIISLDNMQTQRGTADEKGTGHGRLLTRDFIEKHNGTILVTSEPAKGSRFIIILPEK